MRNSIVLQAIFFFAFNYLTSVYPADVDAASVSSSSANSNFFVGCIISGNQTVFYEDLPARVFANEAYGGNCGGNYNYQWQWSKDNVFFKDINGATVWDLNITNDQEFREGATLPFTIYIHRKVTCGSEVQYTNSISITYTMAS